MDVGVLGLPGRALRVVGRNLTFDVKEVGALESLRLRKVYMFCGRRDAANSPSPSSYFLFF